MKCLNCNTPVPPVFTKALADNVCPACGKDIMSTKLYKEFGDIISLMKETDLDNPTLIKLAALFVEKYNITPKREALVGQPGVRVKPKNPTIKRADEIDDEMVEDEVDLSVLDGEELAAELAKRAENETIAKEWGLEDGIYSAAAVSSRKIKPSAELISIYDDVPLGDPEPKEYSGGDAFTQARMAKLAALKNDSSYRMVNRSED